jgi:hypothetical protein
MAEQTSETLDITETHRRTLSEKQKFPICDTEFLFGNVQPAMSTKA